SNHPATLPILEIATRPSCCRATQSSGAASSAQIAFTAHGRADSIMDWRGPRQDPLRCRVLWRPGGSRNGIAAQDLLPRTPLGDLCKTDRRRDAPSLIGWLA